DGARGRVDLYTERHEVREIAKRNLYTGKTYDSVESIRQFFAGQGQPPPAAATAPSVAAARNSATTGAPTSSATPAPPVSAAAKEVKLGSTIEHAKYGRGTIVRLEGSGEDTKVTVSFQGYGLKKLVAKYAGIKVE